MAKPQPIRWTIQKALTEFGQDRETLTKKLREVAAGADGKYSTKQLLSVIYDDAKAERVRLLQQQIRRLEIENGRKSAEQVEAETVFKNYEGIFIAMRQTILACGMTEAEKTECLANLRHDLMEAKPIE